MNNKGVTLTELLIIIVIMGIIASIASISVSEVISNTKKEAFVLVGETMIESARFSNTENNSIWEDNKATLQELVDGGYISVSKHDPWNGTYDYEQSYVVFEHTNASTNQNLVFLSTNSYLKEINAESVVYKVKIVTSVAIIGKDKDLEHFTISDIYFIDASSGSIIDTISAMFNNDLTKNTTLNNSANFFTVQDDIKDDATVKTLDGDDIIILGGSLTDSAYLDTGDGIDTVRIGEDVSNKGSLSTGTGDDIVDVYNKLLSGGNVSTGPGSDTVTIYINFANATLDSGADDDILIIGNLSSGANINAGDGNDKLTVHAVANNYSNATVSLGIGDDRVNIYDTMTGTSSKWDGGLGDDTLFLPEITISNWSDGISSNFTGFETIILKDGTLNP